jgi:hypothetical protein
MTVFCPKWQIMSIDDRNQRTEDFFRPPPYDAVGSLINIAAVGDGQNLNRASNFGTIWHDCP